MMMVSKTIILLVMFYLFDEHSSSMVHLSLFGQDEITCGSSTNPCQSLDYIFQNIFQNGDIVLISAGRNVPITYNITNRIVFQSKTVNLTIKGDPKSSMVPVIKSVNTDFLFHLSTQVDIVINLENIQFSGISILKNQFGTFQHCQVNIKNCIVGAKETNNQMIQIFALSSQNTHISIENSFSYQAISCFWGDRIRLNITNSTFNTSENFMLTKYTTNLDNFSYVSIHNTTFFSPTTYKEFSITGYIEVNIFNSTFGDDYGIAVANARQFNLEECKFVKKLTYISVVYMNGIANANLQNNFFQKSIYYNGEMDLVHVGRSYAKIINTTFFMNHNQANSRQYNGIYSKDSNIIVNDVYANHNRNLRTVFVDGGVVILTHLDLINNTNAEAVTLYNVVEQSYITDIKYINNTEINGEIFYFFTSKASLDQVKVQDFTKTQDNNVKLFLCSNSIMRISNVEMQRIIGNVTIMTVLKSTFQIDNFTVTDNIIYSGFNFLNSGYTQLNNISLLRNSFLEVIVFATKSEFISIKDFNAFNVNTTMFVIAAVEVKKVDLHRIFIHESKASGAVSVDSFANIDKLYLKESAVSIGIMLNNGVLNDIHFTNCNENMVVISATQRSVNLTNSRFHFIEGTFNIGGNINKWFQSVFIKNVSIISNQKAGVALFLSFLSLNQLVLTNVNITSLSDMETPIVMLILSPPNQLISQYHRDQINFHLSCPTNNNPLYFTSVQTLSVQHNYGCSPCANGLYSLYNGYVNALINRNSNNTFDIKTNITNITCKSCPTGGECISGIQSRENFWGYKYKNNSVSFIPCPKGYCCSKQSRQCVGISSCNNNRMGKLCGACRDGYHLDYFTSRCIPNRNCKNVKSFWLIYILFAMAYVIIILYMDKLSSIGQIFKGLFLKVKTFVSGSDEEKESVNSAENKSTIENKYVLEVDCDNKSKVSNSQNDTFSIKSKISSTLSTSENSIQNENIENIEKSTDTDRHTVYENVNTESGSTGEVNGYGSLKMEDHLEEEMDDPQKSLSTIPSDNIVKEGDECSTTQEDEDTGKLSGIFNVLVSFYQLKSLITVNIKLDDRVGHTLDSFISLLFNFDITSFSEAYCPYNHLNEITKRLIKTVLFFLAMILPVIIAALVQRLYHYCRSNKKSSVDGTKKSNDKIFGGEMTFFSRLIICVIRLTILNYKGMLLTFLMLVNCQRINDERVLYDFGEISCWTWWQYLVILILVVWFVPFPLMLFLSLHMLEKGKIRFITFYRLWFLPILSPVYYVISICKTGNTNEHTKETNLRENIFKVFQDSFRKTDKGNFIYWDSWQLLSRLIVAMITVFFVDPVYRLCFISLVMLSQLIVQAKVMPYKDQLVNSLQVASLAFLNALVSINLFRAFLHNYGQTQQEFTKQLIAIYGVIDVFLSPFLFLILYGIYIVLTKMKTFIYSKLFTEEVENIEENP